MSLSQTISDNKRVLLIVLAALVVLGGGVTTWAVWLRKHRPANMTPDQARSFVLTDDFDKLAYKEKADVLDKVGDDFRRMGDGLSDADRRKLFEKAGPVMMQQREYKRAEEYFALPQADRDAYMDKLIDDMQNRMTSRPTSRPRSRPATDGSGDGGGGPGGGPPPGAGAGGPGGPGGPGGFGNPNQRLQRRKDFIENTPPEVRASIDEFRIQMRARMQARGINPPGGGGGGRRGG